MIYRYLAIVCAFICIFGFSVSISAGENNSGYIDTHQHLMGKFGPADKPVKDFDGAAKAAVKQMDKAGIKQMLIMPPPQTVDQENSYTCKAFLKALKKYPGRFAFLGGGGTLNVLIQKAVKDGETTDEMKKKFEKIAAQIIEMGAVGFGEMAAEHFSFNPRHPYIAAPPDHPLFLLLSDLAAKYDVPIDLHMEAIPEKMDLPRFLQSPPNPETLKPNMAAFEKLLEHNRKAKIVWVHTGWDNTDQRTEKLTRELLKKHPNLYISIRITKEGKQKNNLVDGGRDIKPDWLKLIKDYPDRFLIGSDEFFLSPKMRIEKHPSTGSTEATVEFLKQLPADLRRKVGYENARAIYKLK